MEISDNQWKSIYKIGAITTIIMLCGILLDMVVGSIIGGNVAELPQTAVERFNQFKDNQLLGLYNLDLLNTIIQIIFIPSIFASVTSYIGITGNSLMVIYVILVTFIPAVEKSALVFATPAGLLVMVWMIMFTGKLFKLSRTEDI